MNEQNLRSRRRTLGIGSGQMAEFHIDDKTESNNVELCLDRKRPPWYYACMEKLKFVLTGLLIATAIFAKDSPNTDAKTFVSRRDLLTVRLSPEKSIARVEIKEVTLPPGTPTGYHLHPCPTVGVVESGEVAFQIEGESLRHLRPGDAFAEPANTPIARFDNEGATPVRLSVVYLLGPDDKEIIRLLPPK